MRIRYLGKKEELAGVFSLSFTPEEPIEWVAGQSVRVEVPGLYGLEERRFTISAAPFEKKITITTRLGQSSFKQSVAKLSVGDVVNAYDIQGSFTWGNTPRKRLFVASGIGLTPYFSILKQRVHEGESIPVSLLHASRELRGLFRANFEEWQSTHPEFSYIPVTDRISGELIGEYFPRLAAYTVYLSGPSAMVDEVGHDLVQHGGLPEAQLKKDWFTGRLGRED